MLRTLHNVRNIKVPFFSSSLHSWLYFGEKGEAVDKHLRPLFPLLADHLSARSSSITWIHWNIIIWGRQVTNDFYLVPDCCFFQWVFSLGLTEQMWFLPLISYWEVVMRILIYCSYCFSSAWFFPLMQGHFSWALLKRKALHCGKISLSVKRQKMPCWRSEDLVVFTGDYSSQIACYVAKKTMSDSNLSIVSVLANSFHQDLMHSGWRATAAPKVCLQSLPLPAPRDFFHPFPKQRACSQTNKRGKGLGAGGKEGEGYLIPWN